MRRARVPCADLRNQGPILKTRIALLPQDADDLDSPKPPEEHNALIDTGSSTSCIRASLAASFEAGPNDEWWMSGINADAKLHDVYEFQLALLDEFGEPFWERRKRLVAINKMLSPSYDLIIGRDILGLGTLVYHGRRFAFRLQIKDQDMNLDPDDDRPSGVPR